jgi:gamma-glutamyltranspeptidase/glutathione hydrolase
MTVVSGGAVAAGHPLTAEAAAEILQAGGNAFDAAVAAAAMACVAEPVLASPGGGGFMLSVDRTGTPQALDFFGRTPRRKQPTGEIEFTSAFADFGTTRQEFHIGMGATATPGFIAGLSAIASDHGSLPLTELFAPAIQAARDGVVMNGFQSKVLSVVAPIDSATAEARALYAGSDGLSGLLARDDRFRNPDLASFFERLALDGEDYFYRGDAAALIAGLSQQHGGHIGRDDLAAYKPGTARPLSINYRGWQLETNPAPSTGGVLVALGLALLQESAPADGGSDEDIARLTAIMAETDSLKSSGDVTAERLLGADTIQAATDAVRNRLLATRGTTHISTVDTLGNAVALTLSNGEGNGRVVPGCGFMLNNVLGEEDINPGGFHLWTEDRPMASMMAPTILTAADGGRIVLGSGGSNRIRSAVLQVIRNLAGLGMDVRDAVEAPRLHVENGEADAEPGFGDGALKAIEELGLPLRRWPEQSLFFGGAHVAACRNGRFEAAGDRRRDGAAICL